MRSLLFSPGVLICMRACVHIPRVEFLFPQVLWNSCNQSPLAFKARFPGGFYPCCQTSRLGMLSWHSELSRLWEHFCDTFCSLWVTDLGGMGFDFISSCTSLRSCWSCCLVFGCRLVLGVGSSILCGLLFMSCDFGVFVRGELTFFYSSVLSPPLPYGMFCFTFMNSSLTDFL